VRAGGDAWCRGEAQGLFIGGVRRFGARFFRRRGGGRRRLGLLLEVRPARAALSTRRVALLRVNLCREGDWTGPDGGGDELARRAASWPLDAMARRPAGAEQ
jgi:hypothetical protein